MLGKVFIRVFRVVTLVIVFGYLVLCFWLYLAQEGMLFIPRTIAPEADLGFKLPHDEIYLDAPDGARLHGVIFHAELPVAVILYFHGNAENILDMEGTAAKYVELGYSFLAVDYRSYGKSRGVLSEANLFADASLFFAYLKELGWVESDIVISGRSIGTAIATELASRTTPRALVLYSGFSSITDIAAEQFPYFPVRLVIRYPFDSARYMESVRCPVLMFHGKDDPVVPLHHAEKLAAIRGELLVFENGNHDNLTGYPSYWEAFRRVVGG